MDSRASSASSAGKTLRHSHVKCQINDGIRNKYFSPAISGRDREKASLIALPQAKRLLWRQPLNFTKLSI